ncbi:hypothetical protein HPB47_003361 [Ixodes persulcatus]|uniref:Uncharacterized protein n=1 Tax=Ixodes persulcatus TaxID=34615 RepID=A0AC60PJT3_IXOPE|nr:hypothetical protein HPB47_003361 [Ixodes persulcatus]
MSPLARRIGMFALCLAISALESEPGTVIVNVATRPAKTARSEPRGNSSTKARRPAFRAIFTTQGIHGPDTVTLTPSISLQGRENDFEDEPKTRQQPLSGKRRRGTGSRGESAPHRGVINDEPPLLDRSLVRATSPFLLGALQAQLNEVDAAIEPLVPEREAEQNFVRTIEYSDRVVTCIATLQEELKEVRARAPRNLDSSVMHNNGNATTTACRVKLPKLELLKFDGKSISWQECWRQFEQVIHTNDQLTTLDKFGYLRAAVTGEASSAIRGLPPTSRCYEDAVLLLKKRFGNEDILVQTHMRKLLDLQPVRDADDVRGLRRLYDTIISHLRGLEALGQKHQTFGALLCPVVQRALPKEILLDFNRTIVNEQASDVSTLDASAGGMSTRSEDSQERPTETSTTERGIVPLLSRLLAFLRVEVRSRENLAAQQAMDTRQQPHGLMAEKKNEKKGNPGERYQSSAALLHQSTKPDSCFFCKEKNHATAACPADISIEEKKRLLRLERRCFRCTKPNHRSNECRSSMQCTKCSRRHATTMCDPGYTPTKAEANRNAITSAPVNLESATNGAAGPSVLLQTATIWCAGETNGTFVRALFDGGSQRSFITKSASERLECKISGQETLTVGVFGGHQSERAFNRVLVSLTAQNGKIHQIEVIETDVICDQKIPIPEPNLKKLLGQLKMADLTNNNQHGDIDLLIGSEHYWDLVTGKSKPLKEKLRAVETAFGWSIQGPVRATFHDVHCTQTIALKTFVAEAEATDCLERFLTEDEGDNSAKQRQLDSFEESIKRVGSRYEVALPWKPNVNLDDNREMAEKRLTQLTNRLQRTPDLLREYDAASMGRKDVEGVHTDLHRSWTHRQMTVEAFLRRWSREYLAELRNVQSQKQLQGKLLEEGDLILLRDGLRPRQQRRRARIKKVFPG